MHFSFRALGEFKYILCNQRDISLSKVLGDIFTIFELNSAGRIILDDHQY